MDIEKIRLLKEVLSNDLYKFVQYFLMGYLSYAVPDFHKEIYSILPKTKRLVLAAPRGFAKSSISSIFYPIWCALFAKERDICIVSATEGLAVEMLRAIKRELESNRRILTFFGDMKSSKWAENHIILSNGVNIRARGAGGQIRGFRPSLVILDDIETDEGVESEEQRKKLKNWVFKACLNTLLPEGQFVVVGTILHPLSLLADLLTIKNGWNKLKFQAYKGEQKEGQELWKALWSHERLQQRKAEIGSTRFSSEYLNNPLLDESSPIKEEHIRYWEEMPKQYSSVIAVDPAYSDEDSSDYKVAVLVSCDQAANRYLAHYIRTHQPIGEFQDSVINLYLRNRSNLTGLGIPNSGVEKAFFDSFLKKCDERKIYPPIVELKNTFTNSTTSVSARNKKSRVVAALQPLFEQGKYYISPDHIEAREELLTIGSSRWDDLVDAMAYAEQLIQPYAAGNQEEFQDEYNREPVIKENYGL
jgi:phage terminase large subunit-like protein